MYDDIFLCYVIILTNLTTCLFKADDYVRNRNKIHDIIYKVIRWLWSPWVFPKNWTSKQQKLMESLVSLEIALIIYLEETWTSSTLVRIIGINIEGSIKALKLKILMPHDSLKPRALIFKYLCEAKSVCCYSFKNNKTINCSICVVCCEGWAIIWIPLLYYI